MTIREGVPPSGSRRARCRTAQYALLLHPTKDKRRSHPFSSPVPGKECAGAAGRTADIRATSSLSPRTALLVTVVLQPRAAIGIASLPGHHAHDIRVIVVEVAALRETLQPGAGGAPAQRASPENPAARTERAWYRCARVS